MYRGSPFRSTINTNVITGLGMCRVCTEAIPFFFTPLFDSKKLAHATSPHLGGLIEESLGNHEPSYIHPSPEMNVASKSKSVEAKASKALLT